MRVLAEAVLYLSPHPALHLQELLFGELELGQSLGNLPGLLGEPVGYRRHHGSTLPAAALRQEEADVRVGNQPSHGLVQTSRVPGGHGDLA